jgi:predicted Zn-dependent peptidase
VFCLGIVAPGKTPEEVEKGMYAELERVMRDGVTDEELTKAKNITEAQSVGGRMGVYDKALALSNAYRFDKSTAAINEEMTKYLKVTKADIQRVAKRIFGSTQRVVLTYIPTKG